MTLAQSLSDRLAFMRLDDAARGAMLGVKPLIMRALPEALDRFYAQVRTTPETQAFFASQAHIDSAKSRQLGHWETISSGRFDLDYVRAVTTVGETHARIGLEPRWYIGGYALVLEQLINALVKARWPKAGLVRRKGPGAAQVAAELAALAKATLLDMDYAISVYLEAAEAARRKAESEVLARERAIVVGSVGAGLAALADGDLTYRIRDDLPPEYLRLRDDFNAAVGRLEETIAKVDVTTASIGASADEMARAADDLSRRTEQQAAGLEQTAAALDEITATVRTTADGARSANAAVVDARGEAQRSGEVVGQAVTAMDEIERSSSQITQIIGVIDEIAFQTNLLALNAGVEAARAGDAGRGFAVVASEVRALAQRSADAAKEIKTLISASSAQVGRGVVLVGETGQALQAIISKVAEIDTVISSISASAQEQATGLAQVNTAVNQMDQMVQQNAAMVEEATAATHSLKDETAGLISMMASFKVAGNGEAAPRPSPARIMRGKLMASFGGAAPATDQWEEF